MITKIGCCGFPITKEKYCQHFHVVELQQTFYQPPQLKTAKRWREEVPEGFEFALKAWQLITHEPSSPTYRRLSLKIAEGERRKYGFFRTTNEVLEAWAKTEEVARILRAKMIVFQSPPSFHPTAENMKNLTKFFKAIDRKDFLFAWEPRGAWKAKDTVMLCRKLGLIHCVDPFKADPAHGPVGYFRLHGKAGYRHHYSRKDLDELKDKLNNQKTAYLMFNNVSMYSDAKSLQNLLKGS
jgi:uncharacterized protein YecE (DUF72 family)